ncbi:hypothetical protein QWZ18_14785, partial [Methylobacterium longum]|nr:hypothetical protein [Methylobacterium longum]
MSDTAVHRDASGDFIFQDNPEIGAMTKMVDSNVARVAESALPAAPFVVGGLRLDWAAKRSLDVGVAVT